MQNFQNTVDQNLWAFEDDVVVSSANGVYSFATAGGVLLDVPATLVPYTPSAATLLATAQQQQIGVLYFAYQTAYLVPVSYTSKGGVTKTYQADPSSVGNLSQMLLAFSGLQTVPAGFYWVALDNTQVPFTYADMQGLAAAFGVQGAAAFAKYQFFKSQVKAATSVSAVQSIVWE